ncbi:unnamed protein product [Caenorhabditis sp. 36 PRJEB53466]|nr:unnamed protein product [Caenorhabditis sp. 36 PRJEB53466]
MFASRIAFQEHERKRDTILIKTNNSEKKILYTLLDYIIHIEVIDSGLMAKTSTRKKSKALRKSARSTRCTYVGSKNWNDLPAELKSLCIERMTFKTKTRLARTSHTEKALVASAKPHHFDELWVGFDTDNDDFTVKTDAGDEHIAVSTIYSTRYGYYTTNYAGVTRFAAHVLKNGRAEKLNLAHSGLNNTYATAFKELEKCAPFRIAEILSNGDSEASAYFFIKNCEEQIKTIYLMGSVANRNALANFEALPQFVNAAKITALDGYFGRNFSPFLETVQKWINNDAKIGTSKEYKFSPRYKLDMAVIIERFDQRILFRDELTACIVTNNPEKYILFVLLDNIISCEVIRSNSQKNRK